MPSVSKKQARFMAAAAHNSKFAKKAGIKQSVAKEFNKHDAGTGILKKGAGGAIQQVLSRVSQGNRGPIGRAVRGALARVPRPAPPPPKPVDPGEMIRKGSAFRGRNAGPIKANPVTEADNTLSETGEGLRRTIGRIAGGGRYAKGGRVKSIVSQLRSLQEALNTADRATEKSIIRQQEKLQKELKSLGVDYEGDEDNVGTVTRTYPRPKKFKEGGKVASGLSALQQLAKAYREALDMDDTEKALRLKRQMERVKPGSSKSVEDPGKKASDEKVATFAKGGRVSRIKRMQEILARDFRTAKKLKDTDPVQVRFGSKEDTHVRAGGKKYSFQAGSDDDQFVFRSKDGEEVPVKFSKEWLKENE